MSSNFYWRLILHLCLGYFLQVALLQGRWMGYYGVLYPYVLVLLSLPMRVNRVGLLFVGFGLGLLIDVLYSTLGAHAFACVVLAYVRPFVINAMTSQSMQKMHKYPHVYTMGWVWYVTYASGLIVIHHILVYILEAGIWLSVWRTLLQCILSSVMTLGVMCVWEVIVQISSKRPKRTSGL